MARINREVLVDEIREVSEKPVEKEIFQDRLHVPTGCTLLNLSCSDTPDGAFPVGTIANIVGASSSGKSFEAMSVFAEVCQREEFNDYSLIYDDTENADLFDKEKLFGARAAARIESPAYDENGDPINSFTVRQLQANLTKRFKEGVPFIYVCDSLDALTTEEELERADELEEIMEKNKEIKGSYKMEKPKQIGELLRITCHSIKKTNSLVVLVSQVRDNVDPMSFEKDKVSGGRALEFYCCHRVFKKKKKEVKSRERVIGNETIADVKKNKRTGKRRQVPYTIYYDYGIDDIGSMVDFMISEKAWKGTKTKIKPEGLGDDLGEMTPAAVVKWVEDNGKEDRLRKVVAREWNKIEKSLELGRKRKYE